MLSILVDLLKTKDYDKKTGEVEGKIPTATDLVTIAALNAVENIKKNRL